MNNTACSKMCCSFSLESIVLFVLLITLAYYMSNVMRYLTSHKLLESLER